MTTLDTGKRFRIIGGVVIVAFLLVFGLVAYFSMRNTAQVETFRARVAGRIVAVGSPGGGRLLSSSLEVGDFVRQGEEMAVMELSVTSSAGAQRVLAPVRAPLSGIVVAKTGQEGGYYSSGQPLFTIADPNDVWVEASIHESRIARVKVGQRVRVRIRALKVSFPGRVEQISQASAAALAGTGAMSSTQNAAEIPIRISLDTLGYTLYPGLSAEVHVQVEPRLW